MKLVGSREAVRSPELHKQKQLLRRARLLLFIILIALLIVAPVIILRSKKLQITSVNIEGNKVTKNEDIEKLISDKLDGKYLWLVPKSSSVLFSRSGLEQTLLAAMPRLATANVSLVDAHTLKISLTERVPYALYCSDTTDRNNPSKCFFIDETGYIFSAAPAFSGGVYTVYANNPALSAPLGTRFVDEGDFKNLDGFIKNVKRLRLDPEVVTKSGDGYDAMLRNGPVLKWRAEQNLENLASDLESFLTQSKLKLADLAALQYIDLRFDNKVFYK